MKSSEDRKREILDDLRNTSYWRGYNDHIKKDNNKDNSVNQALTQLNVIIDEQIKEARAH